MYPIQFDYPPKISDEGKGEKSLDQFDKLPHIIKHP